MSNRALGVLCSVIAIFLWFYAIPQWVSAPSNVSRLVLSPTFWPLIIAALIGLCGAYLLFIDNRQTADEIESLEQPENRTTGFIRLFMAAVAMVLFLISVETAGFMILFLVMIFIVTQTISIRFFVIAVILPVALYGFFAHVASVAIPQGEWMQLP